MNLPEPSELELIRRVRAGDDDAFTELVNLHLPALYRVVQRLASDAGEAEAIVQEAFLRAWRALRSLKIDAENGKGTLFPYLVTIALNLRRDQWRKERFLDFNGLDALEEILTDPIPGPEAQVERGETLKALARAVAGLPAGYRAVIALRYDAGLDYKEIATTLGLPVNTVRTHLRRAKAYLRELIQAEEELIEAIR